jgi:hypothetical protein
MDTPYTTTLLVVLMFIPYTSTHGYTLHDHTASGVDVYTLHVHTVGSCVASPGVHPANPHCNHTVIELFPPIESFVGIIKVFPPI